MKTIQQLYDKKNLTLEDLAEVRENLKFEIENQQKKIITSSQRMVTFPKITKQNTLKDNLLSLISLISNRNYGRTRTVIEGIWAGYRISRNIMRIFRR
jgi:hypothetical protein